MAILTVEIYRGDTFENFLKSAIFDGSGRVSTDRKRNPMYNFEGTCTSRKYRGVSDPFSYALREALDRGETPCILAGAFPLFSRPVFKSITTGVFVLLPEGVNMPVDKLWLPRPDFDWRDINLQNEPDWLRDHNDAEIWRRLELFAPTSLLDQHSK